MRRRAFSTTSVALVLATASLVISGCGGSGSHRPAFAQRSALKWVGSTQRIVSAKVPDGPAFSIVGQRYRFWGHTYLQIATRFAAPWRVADAGSESGWGDGGGVERSRLFEEEISVTAGCQLRPFVIVRGLLKRSGDAVFARVGGRMVRLSEVSLPLALGSDGVLVYGSASIAPSGFTVRTRSGLIGLNRLSWSRSNPSGCAGRERVWVQAHFGRAHAGEALARIEHCLQQRGFEVGAPDESPFEVRHLRRSKWRQFKAAQQQCRTQAGATVT